MRAAPLVALALLAGCGKEHVCPDPVGRIVRDDCEVYRTKYEALKVELGASLLGLVGARTSLGQSSLRDPSDLIQVLSHRTLALCRDFNSCRVPPLAYRQRRDRTDRIFTAVSTIQEQLRQGNLDAESKGKLVQRLVRVLSEDVSSGGSGAAGAGTADPCIDEASGLRLDSCSYHSHVPWFGTRLLPPQPRSPAGFPVLAATSFSLQETLREVSPDVYSGVIGYRATATLHLLGPVEADDLITVDWGGRTTDCPLGHGSENGLVRLQCAPPRTLALTGSSFTIKVTYRRGADGKSALIGQRTMAVLSRYYDETQQNLAAYGLAHDAQAREGRLVFRPYTDELSPELEQPALEVVLKMRTFREATARCWVNGQLATQALEASLHGGYLGGFQDLPRYRTIDNQRRPVAEPSIEWRSRDFPLPFVVRRGAAPLPDKLKPWPLQGSWRCVISVEGEPVRELTFKIGADGKPAVHPRQLQQPEAGWLVETKLLPNPFEVPIR